MHVNNRQLSVSVSDKIICGNVSWFWCVGHISMFCHLWTLNILNLHCLMYGGTAAVVPPPFRHGEPALWEQSPSHPILV